MRPDRGTGPEGVLSVHFARVISWLLELGGDPGGDAGGRSRRLRFTFAAVLAATSIVGALSGLLHLWVHVQNDFLNDVPAYYNAAQRLNAGLPLYPPNADPDLADYYRYPPLLAILARPFALLPFPVFGALWEAGTIVVLYLFVYRLGFTRRTAITMGLLGSQLGDVVGIGQAHAHVAWLMALGTPWSIALAGQLKLFPALIALYWIGRGEYRQFFQFVAWSLGLIVFQFVLGPGNLVDFAKVLTLENVGNFDNWSPYAISPGLWFALVLAFALITPFAARTRFGWPIAVFYATLVNPRLFGYHLLTLGAAVRKPDDEKAKPPMLPKAVQGP